MAGMRILFCTLAALMLQQSSGCDQPKAAPIPKPPLHRFENVFGLNGSGVALDTVTGQWCRTWEWSYKADSMSGGLDTLPLCYSIFKGVAANPE